MLLSKYILLDEMLQLFLSLLLGALIVLYELEYHVNELCVWMEMAGG